MEKGFYKTMRKMVSGQEKCTKNKRLKEETKPIVVDYKNNHFSALLNAWNALFYCSQIKVSARDLYEAIRQVLE